MARIKPFKGIRPPKDLIEQVASRPYDVLNSEEAREEAKGNEKSLYHIIKPEIDFPVGTDEHDPAVSLLSHDRDCRLSTPYGSCHIYIHFHQVIMYRCKFCCS